MVYSTTLERWHTRKGIESSNLSTSALLGRKENTFWCFLLPLLIKFHYRRFHSLEVHVHNKQE